MPNLQDDQKPHCPVMRYFGAAKNSIATSCGISERQKTALPSCAEFRNDQKQLCQVMRDFGAAKRNIALLCGISDRSNAKLASCSAFQDGLAQFCRLPQQFETTSCNFASSSFLKSALLKHSGGGGGFLRGGAIKCPGTRRPAGLCRFGALERLTGGRGFKSDQVTIMVIVCDHDPTTLSLPMILQRNEYSLPDCRPTISMFVQSPKLFLWYHPASILGSPSVIQIS